MAWATADPEFRVKLLRFVDVLPGLRTQSAVADHVRQYFRQGGPAPIRLGSAVSGAGAFRPVLSQSGAAGRVHDGATDSSGALRRVRRFLG